MKPMILLLAATALTGAAQPRTPRPEPPYEAGGFEPSWQLEISNGRLVYDPGQAKVAPINAPLPPRQALPNGYRYVVPGLVVEVRHERCDSYGGRTFADTVRVSGIAEPGCGGRPIAPDTLKATSWQVGAIGGSLYQPGEVNVQFTYDGMVSGSAGCTDFTMSFTERRPVLRFGQMTVTRRDCEGLGLEREQRALAMFSGQSRISFVDGDTLILTGRHGIARLNP